MNESVIEFRRVGYRIGGREILRDVSLSVYAGETLVLLGRSGSGKTTLLKMVNRLIARTSGEIVLNGQSLDAMDPVRLRRGIGYVIQDGGLFPHRTVEHNIGLVPRLESWKPEDIRVRVADLMNLVGLNPAIYASRYPRQLSGGERQRVGIARALAADPPLLLFDEPFSALDPLTRYDLQREFLRLRSELRKTAIFVTHDIREALLIASRVAILKEGVIEAVLPPEDFMNAQTPEASAYRATIAS